MYLVLCISVFGEATCNKTVTCIIRDNNWSYYGKTLKTCEVKNQAIQSEGYVLKAKPDTSVKAFSIKNNKYVKFIPENLSENFPELMAISIKNCSVKNLYAKPFKNLRKLQILLVKENEIEYVPGDAFIDLINLEHLELKNNKIQFLSANVFNSLVNLESLLLRYNSIEKMSDHIFAPLINLKNISFGSNLLSDVPKNMFKNNLKLEHIWFDNNKIISISASFFDNFRGLHYVDLKGNICVNKHYHVDSFATMKTDLMESCQTAEGREILRLQAEIADAKSKLLENQNCKESVMAMVKENEILPTDRNESLVI